MAQYDSSVSLSKISRSQDDGSVSLFFIFLNLTSSTNININIPKIHSPLLMLQFSASLSFSPEQEQEMQGGSLFFKGTIFFTFTLCTIYPFSSSLHFSGTINKWQRFERFKWLVGHHCIIIIIMSNNWKLNARDNNSFHNRRLLEGLQRIPLK